MKFKGNFIINNLVCDAVSCCKFLVRNNKTCCLKRILEIISIAALILKVTMINFQSKNSFPSIYLIYYFRSIIETYLGNYQVVKRIIHGRSLIQLDEIIVMQNNLEKNHIGEVKQIPFNRNIANHASVCWRCNLKTFLYRLRVWPDELDKAWWTLVDWTRTPFWNIWSKSGAKAVFCKYVESFRVVRFGR